MYRARWLLLVFWMALCGLLAAAMPAAAQTPPEKVRVSRHEAGMPREAFCSFHSLTG